MERTESINGVAIRLTDERWTHITLGHSELEHMKHEVFETVAHPHRILAGNNGELLAIREIEPEKYIVVVYTEQGNDGFIITSFLTRRIRSLNRRYQLWP